jgi:hypothetical protein
LTFSTSSAKDYRDDEPMVLELSFSTEEDASRGGDAPYDSIVNGVPYDIEDYFTQVYPELAVGRSGRRCAASSRTALSMRRCAVISPRTATRCSIACQMITSAGTTSSGAIDGSSTTRRFSVDRVADQPVPQTANTA